MRKKMYKVKKRWVVASAATVAVVLGASGASADEQNKNPQVVDVKTSISGQNSSSGQPASTQSAGTDNKLDVSVELTQGSVPAASTETELPNQGSYTFKEVADIKAEPKVASPTLAQYDPGQTVNYDGLVNSENLNWLTYLSYSGNRRYIAVEESAKTAVATSPVVEAPKPAVTQQPVAVSQPATPAVDLPAQGTYTFKEVSDVKSEPKVSSPTMAQYDPGQTVNYDGLVNAENRQWLTYLSYGGSRRYVAISESVTSSATSTASQVAKSTTETSQNSGKGSASQGNYSVFNKVIYLDAGHGGVDSGAAYGDQTEKAFNLDMQNRVKAQLEAQGYQVVLTRTNDTFVDLLPRSKKANSSNADIFISIHFNASGSTAASGIETYYYQSYKEYPSSINGTYHNDSERLRLSSSLASAIQSQVISTTGAKNNGVKRNTFAVLRETTAPAVLLELGYMSNAAELNKINGASYRDQLANGIVKGINQYYSQNAKLTTAAKPVPATTVALVAKPVVTSAKVSDSSYQVKITGASTSYSRVLVPTWSAKGGQDDIVWYEAAKQQDGSHSLTVDIKNHNYDTGLYHSHVYGQTSSGKLELIDKAEQTIVEPKVKATISQSNKDSYTITVTAVPSYIDKVHIPTWSSKNGQDDIQWYEAVKQKDGSYKLTVQASNHNNDAGLYHSHIYGVAGSRQDIFLGQAVEKNLVPSTAKDKPQISSRKLSDDSFEVTISGVKANYNNVFVPTWSAKSGQDDIQWYEAAKQQDGSYKLQVNIKNHQYDTGLYYSHVYGRTATGKLEWIDGVEETIAALNVQAVAKQIDKDAYTITIKSVPSYIDSIFIPTWSAKGGQDDIVWYEAQKQRDGSYTLTVNSKNHKNDTGLYYSHVYGNAGNRRNIFLGQDLEVTLADPKTQAKISQVKDDSYTISISDVPSYINSVLVPTWSSKGGQDDIKWYEAVKQTNGTYKLTVNIKDHNYDTGLYYSHVYGNSATRSNIWLGQALEQTIAEPKVQAKIDAVTATGYTITVQNVPSYIDKVRIPTWTEANGQDDVKWYEAKKLSNGFYQLTIDIVNHGYEKGLYHSHIYGEIKNTKQIWLGQSIQQTIKESTTNSFLNDIFKGSLASKKEGILPSISAAQAILESSWGQSQLGAEPNYNLFGIKASDDWKGEVVSKLTKEYVAGKAIDVVATFRKYSSWDESMIDHSKFFTATAWRRERYSKVIGESDYRKAAEALQKAGYATDPNYAQKLIGIIERLNLNIWDTM